MVVQNFSLRNCFKENYTTVNIVEKENQGIPMGRGKGNKGERTDRASGGNLMLSKTLFRSLRRLSEETEFGMF